MLIAEANLLIQAIDNLLDNAYKYTPEKGRVQLQLSVTSSSIAIEISDSGIGIPEDSLSKIFESFYWVRESQKGFGLGLAIGKQIVKLHQGKMTVNSIVEKGTTFAIELPK